MDEIKGKRSNAMGLLRVTERLKCEAFGSFYLHDTIFGAGFSLESDFLVASRALEKLLQISKFIELFAA